MFSEMLAAELAGRIGARVLIATDHAEVTGHILNVTGNLITVVENNGYGAGTTTSMSALYVNFVRFLPPAA
ncbi:hypothetical protein [uncultured Metabacillus sp.]|uniref:hypothetical protein n=1 Tax=uncultured Metabacillus sp. TaxID=2860135 RepID=UPI00263537EA|nr:hypothetical protein [uncultured Metabacillus sp.]